MIFPAENLQTSALCRKLIQKEGLVEQPPSSLARVYPIFGLMTSNAA
jgi:hypothetical protein